MKSFKISDETHMEVKIFCVKNKLKMNEWVDVTLKQFITNKINNNDNNKGNRNKVK